MAGQVWLTNSLGGYLYSPNLSKKLRTESKPMQKFRQFCDIKEGAVGLHKGQTFHWNVISKLITRGGKLVETNTMPKTNFTITQGTMTISEFGNSVDYTGLLNNLSEQPITEIIKQSLKNDAAEAYDTAAHAEFNKALLRVIPTNGTDTKAVTLYTNGTVTGTNNVDLGKDHIKSIVDLMAERNIPGYIADDYMALARPTTLRPVKDDLESVYQYTTEGFGRIVQGEVGRYEGCRFAQQTQIDKENWTNGKSDWAFFFGADTVAEGIAIAEEIRGKTPGDFGRDQGFCWYGLEGFALTQIREVDARIIKWDSAA